jgi:hypothetical protein
VQTQAFAGDAEEDRRGDQQATDAEGRRLGRGVQARVEIAEAHQPERTDEGEDRPSEDQEGQQDFE